MKKSGWWRLRRQVILAMVVAVCAAVLGTSATASSERSHGIAPRASASLTRTLPALAVARASTTVRGFETGQATITLGSEVEDTVSVVPRTRRVILVQARALGSTKFVTQSSGRTSSSGRFRAVYHPASAGAWEFRLVVPATATKGKTKSAARVVTAVDRAAPGGVTQLAVSEVGFDLATLRWVNPVDEDFTGVMVRRAVGTQAPASPTQGTGVADTGRQLTQFTDTGLTVNTKYSYALFAHDGAGNVSRAATITLRTSRVAVTALLATSVTRTTVDLAWDNPADGDFTGAVIRRAVGPTAPVSATDGTAISDVLSPESTFTDNGLNPGTQYSYAVFAHDADDHFAAAATVTIQTRPAGTFAALSVNPMLPNGAKVTVDTVVAFDASQSQGATGRELTSWSLDYGDGSPVEEFTGPFGPPDILNSTHAFSNAGTQSVTLTVTDSNGDTATDIVPVQVYDAPRVSISMTTSSPQQGVPVTFEVETETPRETAITSYEMAISGDDSFFIDGELAPPNTIDVTFTPGTYTVIFTFVNDAGGTAVSDPVAVVVP